ncbi:MAG: FadR family transcriptional regulator [Rhodobacteraceae bacterium]|nr:FadR family transcriptional regulator [Paracoccaceae bacterium]
MKTLTPLKVRTDIFDPIIHGSLARSTVLQIEDMILGGVLTSGMKLPAERDMAAQMQISRPKLREALTALEQSDLIEIRPGEGAFIRQLTASAMAPALIKLYSRPPSAIHDHLDYRSVQEGFASRLAAARATQTDRDMLSEIIAQMRAAHAANDHDAGVRLDTGFHIAIANASHNRTLIHMMTALYNISHSTVFFDRAEITNIADVSGHLLAQHVEIADAILAQDPARAQKAAEHHIDYVRLSTNEALARQQRETDARKRRINLAGR